MNMCSISYCNGCKCMTKSIKEGRASFVCGKCGYDKSLGDNKMDEFET